MKSMLTVNAKGEEMQRVFLNACCGILDAEKVHGLCACSVGG